MKCLRFRLEAPYLVNFRKPFSTISILSYPFPPYTTIRGLLANALGLQVDDYSLQEKFKISLKPLSVTERTHDIVLMKKLKSSLKGGSKKPNEQSVVKKLWEHNWDLSILNDEELAIYEGLKHPRNTSAPFVKEFITRIECIIYVLAEEKNLSELRQALENPARPLYIGASDDFVVISDIQIVDGTKTKSDEIDSIVRINGEVQPIDRKSVVGRIPYKFRAINVEKRDYSRKDVIVAAPKPNERLKLNNARECYDVEEEYVAF
jgi:CRISPR-associated protein Cas5h